MMVMLNGNYDDSNKSEMKVTSLKSTHKMRLHLLSFHWVFPIIF